ncbi:MAG: L-serine ammonia-lyase [Rhodobacterales bacterium]|nr:L-serine ammonia-lyase [Rhodobacterales bacterium]
MFLSVFDMFKVGIGPSSSHTMGPMVAAKRFLQSLKNSPFNFSGVRVTLYGSLAFTGKGHATDRAVILGLANFSPDTYDPLASEKAIQSITEEKFIRSDDLGDLSFDPQKDLKFDYGPPLSGHPNGIIFTGLDDRGDILFQETYYSIGGGFVLTSDELAAGKDKDEGPEVPFPFSSAEEMLVMSKKYNLSISQMKKENELSRISETDLDRGIKNIWEKMDGCIERGLCQSGVLPGGLNVKRRAKGIYDALMAERGLNLTPPHTISLIKFNASISGAEAGCQAEVGSASAMAAAGLCAVLGGTSEQIENAAEIALEHHLGMTCDPVAGLVQVPCIERNGLGAIKAVSAASLSLRGDGTHLVPLDACVETMRQTGEDMINKYKETSLGGLAVNIPNC